MDVAPQSLTLNDPETLRRVNALRRVDNWRSWFYLLREYLFLALVLGGAGVVLEGARVGMWHWAWAVPVVVLANLCVGAGQHRLATLTHEAAHYMLFKNRRLNEFVSEWFCMFPILGTTHSYRVQHLGHHQYPNDQDKDPDWAQMTQSGHRFRFPMSLGRFLWDCFLKQILWPPALIRYVLVRASYVANLGDGPYRMRRFASRWMKPIGLAFHLPLLVSLGFGVALGDVVYLTAVPAGLLAMAWLVYTAVPTAWIEEYSIRADIAPRSTYRLRATFNTLLWTALAWATHLSGVPVWAYFVLLWIVPLGTSFAFFMILRQIVQHGNADQERFTNTRIFLVNPLIRLSVFPIGNDYHLPHHLFPLVPHYRLAKLHAMLQGSPEYREHAIVVDGYFAAPGGVSVVDLMTTPIESHAGLRTG